MNTEVYEGLGVKVRERRAELGLTQAQLAALAGLSRSALANIETGRQAVLLHDFLALAKNLDLPPEALLPSADATTTGSPDEMPRSVRLFVETMMSPSAPKARR